MGKRLGDFVIEEILTVLNDGQSTSKSLAEWNSDIGLSLVTSGIARVSSKIHMVYDLELLTGAANRIQLI